MKKLLAVLIAFGLLTFTVGCPKGDADKNKGTDVDVKLDKTTLDVDQGGTGTVTVKEGKATKADPTAASKLTAKVDDTGKKITITAAADAAEGKSKVAVTGAKGKAEIEVNVKMKKAEVSPPIKEPAKDVKLDPDTLELKQGETKTVKVTEGKADKVDAPAKSGLTGTVEGDKVSVKADDDAKEGDVTLTVKAGKEGGKDATLKVTVKKK